MSEWMEVEMIKIDAQSRQERAVNAVMEWNKEGECATAHAHSPTDTLALACTHLHSRESEKRRGGGGRRGR